NYSALHFFKNSDEYQIGLDMEILQYQLKTGYNFNAKWSVLFMQAITYKWDGFMDPFLIWYHEELNLPNYGREERGANDYFYSVSNHESEFSSPQRKWLLNNPVIGIY